MGREYLYAQNSDYRDDTYINNLIAKALSKEGYSYQQAFSGTEGLLYAKTEPFSLVILDLMLPGINGEELLPKLKNDFGLRVIVLSAKDSLDSKIDLLNAGAEDYMTKPFEIDELMARVVFTCANKVHNAEGIDVSQLFTRFYKADPARTHSSTGLGLAIAKGLAERMNGGMAATVEGDWFAVEAWFNAPDCIESRPRR